MTLADVALLYDYWAEHPPLSLMIEGFLGVTPSGRTTPEIQPAQVGDAALGQMMELAAAGIPVGDWNDLHAGLGVPTFDAAELMGRRP